MSTVAHTQGWEMEENQFVQGRLQMNLRQELRLFPITAGIRDYHSFITLSRADRDLTLLRRRPPSVLLTALLALVRGSGSLELGQPCSGLGSFPRRIRFAGWHLVALHQNPEAASALSSCPGLALWPRLPSWAPGPWLLSDSDPAQLSVEPALPGWGSGCYLSQATRLSSSCTFARPYILCWPVILDPVGRRLRAGLWSQTAVVHGPPTTLNPCGTQQTSLSSASSSVRRGNRTALKKLF